MKKLLKILTAVVLLTLFLGCEITLFPDDILENNITITNNTGYTIHTMYLVPINSYLSYRNYSFAKENALSYGSADLLDFDGMAKNETITIDLNDYSGDSFKLVSFEDSNTYVNPKFYVNSVTDNMSSVTIYSSDQLY